MSRWAGLIAITLLLAAAVAVSGSVLVLRVFYVWSLIIILGYLWVANSSNRINFSSTTIPERAQAGSPLFQQITLSTESRLPKIGIRIQSKNNLPGGDVSTILDITKGRAKTWQANYTLGRRGRYSLGAFQLGTTDPFGLFHREITVGSPSEILIHPLTVPMPPFSLLGLNGSGLSKRMPESLSASASNIREYTPGDSMRHIHWRTTAHTGRYMVKVFDAERSRHHAENYWVILDMGMGHAGKGDESTVEYAVTLTASLAKEYISNGYKFGLVAAGTEPKVFPSNTGQEHLTDLMDFLATVEPMGEFSFSELLARNQGLFSSNSTVIIISPATTSSLTESFHQLDSRGCAAAYFLIDGSDFGGLSPASVGRTLTQLGAPVYLLRRSETFSQALEKAANATSWFDGVSRS